MENLTPVFWASALGGAAGGAVITAIATVIVTILKATSDKKTEHAQWLRNEKIRAYTEFLNTVSPAGQRSTEAIKALHLAVFKMEILGGKGVRRTAQSAKRLADDIAEGRATNQIDTYVVNLYELVFEMRKDLDADN